MILYKTFRKSERDKIAIIHDSLSLTISESYVESRLNVQGNMQEMKKSRISVDVSNGYMGLGEQLTVDVGGVEPWKGQLVLHCW